MSNIKQKEQWENFSKNLTLESIEVTYNYPHIFHYEMSRLVDFYCCQFDNPIVIEVGCESGITSMLLKNAKERIFLDYDSKIIEKVKIFCDQKNLYAKFVCEDMFNIKKVEKESCNIVFNSGVIEHYTYSDRVKAIKEYAKILSPNGFIIIAYPNHYSFLYKFAYFSRRLFGGKFWPWPSEYTIKNLKSEIEEANLKYIETLLVDNETLTKFYPNISQFRNILLRITNLFKGERYLRVCIGKKSN